MFDFINKKYSRTYTDCRYNICTHIVELCKGDIKYMKEYILYNGIIHKISEYNIINDKKEKCGIYVEFNNNYNREVYAKLKDCIKPEGNDI